MSYQNGPRIVTNGLVLCLDAGNSKSYAGSGTAWNDLSGNGNNGTLTNGPIYSSANRGSIVFDGTNDYIDFIDTSSASSVGNGDFSLTAFIKPTTNSQYKNIWRRDNATNQGAENRRIIVLSINGYDSDQYLTFGIYDGVTASNNAVYAKNITDGLWHYIVATYVSSSKTLSLYENGILRVQTVYNNTQSFNTARQSWCMGAVSNIYSGEYYKGNIALASIYNKSLSVNEVLQNYNATKGRFGL